MFILEDKYKDFSPDERLSLRQSQLKPIFQAYLSWLQEVQPKVVPRSSLGKAISYSLSNWNLITNILRDGQCELSNNAAERQIKPFVIGRKNYLFCKSPHGAKASAISYSIVETAKLNALNPFYYLKYLLEGLPNTRLSDEDSLEVGVTEDLLVICRIISTEVLKVFL